MIGVSRDAVRTERQHLELLHDNVKKFGTVFNTLAPGTDLSGTLRRRLLS